MRTLRSKKLRAALWRMTDGKCAICGCDLPDSWHADHMSADEVSAVLKARNGQSLGAVLAKRGQYGRGRPKPDANRCSDSTSIGRGNDYLAARLRRDHPDAVFDEAVRGSVRQAAIAAGIVKVPSVLEKLRKLWAKASEADRQTFMDEVACGR